MLIYITIILSRDAHGIYTIGEKAEFWKAEYFIISFLNVFAIGFKNLTEIRLDSALSGWNTL